MKIDIEISFSPSCSLSDSAHFMEIKFGCKFKNEIDIIP